LKRFQQCSPGETPRLVQKMSSLTSAVDWT